MALTCLNCRVQLSRMVGTVRSFGSPVQRKHISAHRTPLRVFRTVRMNPRLVRLSEVHFTRTDYLIKLIFTDMSSRLLFTTPAARYRSVPIQA